MDNLNNISVYELVKKLRSLPKKDFEELNLKTDQIIELFKKEKTTIKELQIAMEKRNEPYLKLKKALNMINKKINL